MAMEKPGELERQEIENSLSDMLNKPLGIVIAPSGYGKTTVVRSFLSRNPAYQHAWVSLGQEEVDDVWVWNRISDKFKEIEAGFCDLMKEVGLPSSAQEIENFIKILRIYLTEPFFLIIDDYHECSSSRINKLISRLCYEDIVDLHIILITRTYPEIPYEEMLLKGYCAVIDQQMLILTKEETEKIFRINGITLTEEESHSIEEYTDGWISAVYLMLFEYKRVGKFGYFQSVAHLLKTAIFEKFSLQMQEVCKKMSLFASFTYEEAVYVTGCDIYPLALSDLMNRFGFMQFDEQTWKYEMHSLLRSVAAAELEKDNCDKKQLYFKCAEWNERNQHFVQAIIYYKSAGKTDKIFELLSGDMRSFLFETAPTIIKDLIEDTPISKKIQYPAAYLTYIYYLVLKEDVQKGKYLLQEAKCKYKELYKDEEQYRELQGELLILETAVQFNNLEQITSSMREALRLRDGQASTYFKQSLLTYGSPQMTMLYHDQSGSLQKVIELEKEYAQYYMKLIGGIEGGWDELFDAEYALSIGNISEAFELAGQVETKAIFRKQTCIIISSYYIRLRCLIYQGKCKEFDDMIQKFHEQMKGIVRPILVMDYELAYSLVYAIIGRYDKMTDWVRNVELEKCSRIVRSIRSGCTAYGMMLSKKGQWILLDEVAEQLLVPYETARHMYVIICGYIYKAIAVYHLEGADRAKGYLLQALELAEPDEERIPFIEASLELVPVIEGCGVKSKFCLSLKPHFSQYQKALKKFEKDKEKITLTAREMEMMKLVETGMRNSEIGEKMSIALVTVEKTLTGVYRKLHVTNRAAAIAKMKDMKKYGFP